MWSKKQPVMDGLVCWLDGRDGNNIDRTSVWKDRSGNGNDATLYNVNFDKNSGWTGKSVKFDGVNDRFLFNYSHKGTSLTFETLCKINKDDSTHDFLEGSSDSPSLYCYNANQIIFKWGNNTRPTFSSTGLFKTGTTVHAFWIVDYTKNILKIIFFIRGVRHSTSEVPITDQNKSMFNTLGINSNGLIRSDAFSYKIYEKALTEEEILHNYEYETKYKDNELFLDSEGLRHLTSKIKDTIPFLSTGLPVPYTPELALNKGLTCVYTGKKPIGYEKLNSGNCREDGTFDYGNEIGGQILKDGSIWFGVGTENLYNTISTSNYASADSTLLSYENNKVAINVKRNIVGSTINWTGTYLNSHPKSLGGVTGETFCRSGFIYRGIDNENSYVKTSIEGTHTGVVTQSYNTEKPCTWQFLYCKATLGEDTRNNFLFYFHSRAADVVSNIKVDAKIHSSQLEKNLFPTPYVEKTRKQTKLVYPIPVTGNLYDKYTIYCEINKEHLLKNIDQGYAKTLLCIDGNDETGDNAITMFASIYDSFYNALKDGVNKILFIDTKIYINGEVFTTNGLLNRGGVQISNELYIFSPNVKGRIWNMLFNKIILFQDKTPFTDDYCKLATTVGFDIPVCKEDAPLYNTELTATGLLKFKESYRINSNTEVFPIKPNCVYKITDRNGKEIINKTNSTNTISAATGSVVVITNVAGDGKINTGSGYEFPLKVEAVIN